MSTKRTRAYHYGLLAEWACVALLSLKGYQILARRWRSPAGEIDIIAARFNTIAFIEVKARGSLQQGLEALQPTQQKRVVAAATHYLGTHAKYTLHQPRFDLMVIAPWRLPVHIEHAWQENRF